MTCGIGIAVIGLLLVIGFGLLLAERRRNKSYEKYRIKGSVKAMPMPTPGPGA